MTRHRLRTCRALVGALALAACSSGGGGEGPGLTVTVQPAGAALCAGDSVAFTAQVRDGSGNLVPSPALAWSSSAPQVATIDPTRGAAHAVATGSSAITATSGGARSAPATLDVPADLVPEFVPDSVVLAPGDTMTLGVRLRRASGGPVPPGHLPAITPLDTTVARLDPTGLLTAKAAGRARLALSACGQTGGGAADVYVPPDSLTGMAYLWLSGLHEVRVRLPARATNYTRTGGLPGVEIGNSGTRAFAYVDTVALSGTGPLALDSLNSSEVGSGLTCQPPRPFATYADATSLIQPTSLFSLRGGTVQITSSTAPAGVAAVSGRMVFRMRGIVAGQLGPGGGPDTLAAVYTFSVPLVTQANVCP